MSDPNPLRDIEAIVHDTLEPAKTALSWTEDDRNNFVRMVEYASQIGGPADRRDAREQLIGYLAFHFTTAMRPTEKDVSEFRDIAVTYVDEILGKLPHAAKISSSGAERKL